MTSYYISAEPLSLAEALQITGWEVDPRCSAPTVMFVTDGENFILVSMCRHEHLFAYRTPGNTSDVSCFVEPLGLLSKDDDRERYLAVVEAIPDKLWKSPFGSKKQKKKRKKK